MKAWAALLKARRSPILGHVDGIDWLSLCRRIVAEQREIFAKHGTITARTEYEGIGSGGDRTLVIDRLCEDVAFAALEEAVRAGGPVLRVISEERGEVTLAATGARNGAARADAAEREPLWVVIDPIDGSLNARRTIPQHSFCLAVASGPKMTDVEFGFVHDFGTREEFAAHRGQGATLNGRPLAPLAVDERSERLEVVGLESADPVVVAPAMEVLAGRAHRLRVIGSIAITLCQVAAGRLDGMCSLRPCRSVDVAAAQLVVSEVGGQVALGPNGIQGAGFGLEDRYPITAAATVAGHEIMRRAQEASPGFS